MKIDQEYLKHLLMVCQESENPTFNIDDLNDRGVSYEDPKFEFHMRILSDQNLIERDDGENGFGLTKSLDGFLSWSVLPLRLTASGHDFIEALANKEVWATIKRDFKDASISSLRSVAMKLLEGFVKKKIEGYLSE